MVSWLREEEMERGYRRIPSSCLVPVSQLPPNHRAVGVPSLESSDYCDSFEIVVSYRYEKECGLLSERNGQKSIYIEDSDDGNSPSASRQHVANQGSLEKAGFSYGQAQGRESPAMATPKNSTTAQRRSLSNAFSPSRVSSERVKVADLKTDSVTRELRVRYNSTVGIVNLDLTAIQNIIVEKILRDAEARGLVVTFTHQGEETTDNPYVDKVNYEFDPIETQPTFRTFTERSIGYILSRIEDNMFDDECDEDAMEDGTIEPSSYDIESFNDAARMNVMRQNIEKYGLMDENEDPSIDVIRRRCRQKRPSAYDAWNSQILRKDTGKLPEGLPDLLEGPPDLLEGPPDLLEGPPELPEGPTELPEGPPKLPSKCLKLPGKCLKLLGKHGERVIQDFSFLKKRKRSSDSLASSRKKASMEKVVTIDEKPLIAKKVTIEEEPPKDKSGATDKLDKTEAVMKIDKYKPEKESMRKIPVPFSQEASSSIARRVIKDRITKSCSLPRGSMNSSSYDLSHSQSRGERTASIKDSSQNSQVPSRRGVLSDARPPAENATTIKPPQRLARPANPMFDNTAADNSDWSSEMWGSFINVIHSRKRTLGHGSFSTVSFAFLRLQPHLGMIGSARPRPLPIRNLRNMSASRNKPADESDTTPTSGESKNSSNNSGSSGKTWSGTKQSRPSTAATSEQNEQDFLSQMLKIIDGYCAKCANVCTLDCAVKSINDVFHNARFQYIREKEMMLHFNSNVLKPLACRYYSEDVNRAYQLLMPKAQGDLLEMLRELIKYRTKKVKKPTFIPYRKFGRKEQKIIGLTEMEVKFLFFQVLSGLAFIQMCFQGNIHRHSDIKLQNILVYCKEDNIYEPLKWRLCLADFGCSIMLHPTQHFGGASMFKNLQQSISKEWRAHLSNQLTSFMRGTVRCNAPEALSYDRHGNPRSNRNNNILMAYKQSNLNMSCSSEYFTESPKVWGQPDVPDDIYRTEPAVPPKVVGATDDDNAEYFTVDMYSDMWSAGIILAELAKFGGSPAIGHEDSRAQKMSAERVKLRINSTLGRGLFCRIPPFAKGRSSKQRSTFKRMVAPLDRRDKGYLGYSNGVRHVVSDENLNRLLAEDIANKCARDPISRLKKMRLQFWSFEFPKFSSGFWSLLVNLLSYNPRDRYLAAEALGHAWFDNSNNCSVTMFQHLDNLMAEELRHLPMEHFYYVGSSLPVHKIPFKSQSQSEGGHPLHLKRENLMSIENSDLTLKSLGMYGKVGQISNAWFSGPLHFRLMSLKDPGVALPDFVANICRRETLVMEAREKDIFGESGFILSKLIDLKKRYMFSWEEMLSSRAVHLLGRSLISSDCKKI